MGGFVHTQGATTTCLHGGQAQPAAPLPRLSLSGQRVIGQSTTYTVAGCPFVVGTVASPCATASWVVAATRVRSTGIPLVLQDSTAVCVPNGTGLMLVPGQTRVRAT
jgi:hypothetical protein